MNNRDLQADLENFEKINKLIPEPTGDFIRDVVAPHALKRAIAAEEEVERLKEEKERILMQMEHLANKPIAVFGEGFGYEEHYRWLKDDLKSLVASIQRIQEGKKSGCLS
ncbi:hypothetical protein M5X00_17415 [Paenibacillus alvei]|uniref:Uncharacterized protein n=1 Tax=Paenibacillus alvei TaxID=44250 RepID=A0ABT4GZQ3_PAEAL|nr:hypothetical protein [Paenibacillus alvei]MCY7486399.1 hypothetical protein [Paenibacillus alvei]MCY9706329.1 hypothetical protein [Paenibacillus alvei]MCY9732235.1 hypothetical protein [Paenibacillus alvei]MCY9756019.1 hypothetical protein [Paenibacillus alvei]MCY9762218.1 hypothetical protein [Paenibacillus alvei]